MPIYQNYNTKFQEKNPQYYLTNYTNYKIKTELETF